MADRNPGYAQMRAFNAVARSGSFSAAARALGVSQPAVTAQVRRLETAHGTQLFDRGGGAGGGGQTARLTDTGQRLYAVTQRLDDIADAAGAVLRGDPDLTGQDLRIATASPQVFMPLIARVRARYPGVVMEITLGSTGEVEDSLLARVADVGLAPVGRDDRRLRVMPYIAHGLVLLAPGDHALAGREAVALADLAGAPLIVRSGPSATQRQVNALTRAGRLAARPVLRLGTREAVLEAVANGLGLALVLARDVPPDPRLAVVPLSDAPAPVWEHVAWLASRDAVATVRAFVAVAGEDLVGDKAGDSRAGDGRAGDGRAGTGVFDPARGP